MVEATPCAYANDGTLLKPAMLKLKFKVDLGCIKEHMDPSTDDFCENMITEAIVSSLTTLDNKFSLPCAVDFATQKGKTGEAMAQEFEKHIREVQVCEACQKRTPSQ